ncbi:SGNH/GDSL hydrolase family protein [Roseobacter weihaiensis]|uniref:SGNH/GDSL hydrolase family protein n=1 Tax=Roseobacter weihaiensis TaxID=2763262 RepID=UPI001D0AAD35|nr:SGNH/GDSL hydrolase family protein [Roseobacter sp. H9]
MGFRFLVSLVFALGVLAGCTEAVPRDQSARILTMGDSMLAWHGNSDGAVSDVVEDILGEPVVDRSVVGARVFYSLPISGAMGMNISKQYRPGAWEWVILNGGGNDLWFGCGCRACDEKMSRMISPDGNTGTVPELVSSIRRTGARVIYVGYLRSPGVGSMIEHCREEGDEFERRIAQMAAADPGVHFVSLADLVPHGDRSYHSFDMIHPSTKASRKIAQRIAAVIR